MFMKILAALAAASRFYAAASPVETGTIQVSAADVNVTLCNIQYSSALIYSTPAHLATYYGKLEFYVENSAVSYVTHCEAQSSALAGIYVDDQIYQCDSPLFGSGYASFAYNRPANTLSLNQTWYDEGGAYMLLGSGELILDCVTETLVNGNWQLGDIYSRIITTCKPITLVLA